MAVATFRGSFCVVFLVSLVFGFGMRMNSLSSRFVTVIGIVVVLRVVVNDVVVVVVVVDSMLPRCPLRFRVR